MTPSTFRSSFAALCVALAAGGALAQSCAAQTPVVTADPRTEIERLQRNGDTTAALQQVDEALSRQPGDAQLRFLQGVLLADAGRRPEAEAVYRRLTQDFPELAEPYNNLAVLYAAEGRLDEARDALETALRNDPAYRTAQENLGDIYVRLAQRAYERAGQPTPELEHKLKLVQALTQPASAPPATQPATHGS
jgi:Flp pilus assembly protein TadD